MTSAKAGDSYIIRLDPGDDILKSIGAACREHDIQNAEITGIGSVETPTLAHYRKDTQHFTEKTLEGIYEIISLLGNVGLVDGQPTAHCHVTISDAQMQPWAGHLKAGVCSATVELVVRQLDSAYSKAHDDAIGLKLWQL
jgi:predicted DNA-binding protein with PD1-like motif